MSRRRLAPRPTRSAGTSERLETRADGAWFVRRLAGASAGKTYRCPGCEQVIATATPHVVVWPEQKALLSESAIDERRHWHTACWARKH